MDSQRIDKWLWAARFFRTRSLAAAQLDKHRVQVNGQDVKASRELRIGDRVRLRQGDLDQEVIVRGLSATRGPAPVARQLYEETAESLHAREEAAARRRLMAEPAWSIGQERPTKRERRQIDKAWNERWSAGS